MTTLETTLPLFVLVIGAIVSIVGFAILSFRETDNLSGVVRWSLVLLRSILCLLVWLLIAQPRAVTTKKESIPVTANLGVDVSQSMSLADESGENTFGWRDNTAPDSLDEAIALTEAAKIRINLLARRFKVSADEREDDARATTRILTQAREKAQAYAAETDLSRLVDPHVSKLSDAISQLGQIEQDNNPMSILDRSATLTTQAATGLRRVAAVRTREQPPEAEVTPRIDLVNRWMDQSAPIFDQLKKDCDLQVSTFATGLSPASGTAREFGIAKTGSAGTHLYENLNQLARGQEGSVGGRQISLAITDGIDTAGLDSEDDEEFSAALRNQPLLILPIGDHSSLPDVRIESLVHPARVREKDIFVAAAEVASFNAVPEAVTVSLLDKDQALASQQVELSGNGETALIELEWKALGTGPRDLRIEVSKIAGEEFFTNNLRPINCTVIKDRYQVLVCDGFPRWETRYLQNLFNRDPSIEMASLIFEPRHTYPGNEPREALALPLALETWQEFDLVILGDVTPTQLSPAHQALLLEYVDRGGNLIILAGKNYMPKAFVDTPVEKLLPMTRINSGPINGSLVISPPEKQTVDRMVSLGKGNTQSIWRSIFSITPQHRISPWAKAKESARTLLVAKDTGTGTVYDFFAVQRFGAGRVSFVAAPCLYHLRFRFGDRYHARLWGQVIRGMCVDEFGFEGGLIKTRLDRLLWEPGTEVQGRVRLTGLNGGPVPDAEFQAVLSRDGEILSEMTPQSDPDRPGEYFVRFADLPPGKYDIEYEGNDIQLLLENDAETLPEVPVSRFEVLSGFLTEEATFAVEPPEFWSRVNALPLAATITPKTLPLVLDALDFKPEVITRTTKRSLWDTWWLLIAIVIIAGIEWCIRRINGLC